MESCFAESHSSIRAIHDQSWATGEILQWELYDDVDAANI